MAFEWTDDEGYTFKTGDGGNVLFVKRQGRDGWAPAHPLMAMSGLAEAERRLEVYRKALEPFLRALSDPVFEAAITGPGHLDAIEEACRLMGGIQLPAESTPPAVPDVDEDIP